MITIAILINGNVLMARSAHNITKKEDLNSSKNIYKVDDGSLIEHNPHDGAVVLAKKMLDTIKE